MTYFSLLSIILDSDVVLACICQFYLTKLSGPLHYIFLIELSLINIGKIHQYC